MKVGHVGMEKGLRNPVMVLRISPPLCIKTHYHCHYYFSINQSINTQLINSLNLLVPTLV